MCSSSWSRLGSSGWGCDATAAAGTAVDGEEDEEEEEEEEAEEGEREREVGEGITVRVQGGGVCGCVTGGQNPLIFNYPYPPGVLSQGRMEQSVCASPIKRGWSECKGRCVFGDKNAQDTADRQMENVEAKQRA